MLRANILLAILVASSGAPSPYYTSSLIETPTSRVESHLLLSAPSHESYKFQPHHVIPQSNFNYAKLQPLASRIVSPLNVDVPKLPALKFQINQNPPVLSMNSNQIFKSQPENDLVPPVQQQFENNLMEQHFQSPTQVLKAQPEASEFVQEQTENVFSNTELVKTLTSTTTTTSTTEASMLRNIDMPKHSDTMQEIKMESYEIFNPQPLSLTVQPKQEVPELKVLKVAEVESESTTQVNEEMNMEMLKESTSKPNLAQLPKADQTLQQNTNSVQSRTLSNDVQHNSQNTHTQVILPQLQPHTQNYIVQPQAYNAQRQFAIPQPYYQQNYLSASHFGNNYPLSTPPQNFHHIQPQTYTYQPHSYNIQPYHPFTQSNSHAAQNPIVYYHQQPQHANNFHRDVNLFELRQEAAWWQDLYNQYLGQGSPQEGSQEKNVNTDVTPTQEMEGNGESSNEDEEKLHEESPEQIKKLIALELAQTTFAPRFNIDDNHSSETTTEDIKPDGLDSSTSTSSKASEEGDSVETFAVTSTTTLKPLSDKFDSIIFDNKSEAQMNASSEITERDYNFDDEKDDGSICDHAKKVKASLHKIYSFNDQYYILSGSPKFYGNIEPRSLMLSLQELQPVSRNDDNDDDAEKEDEKKIAPILTSSSKLNSRLGKIIVAEEEPKEKGNDEPEQNTARLQSPSERQSSALLEKESRDDKKEEVSLVQGKLF